MNLDKPDFCPVKGYNTVIQCTMTNGLEKEVFCYLSGVSLSFELGGTYRRVAGQKITFEVNFFMFSLKEGRY